jgi:hypothetical protein
MARAPKFRFTPAFINGLKNYRWCDSKPHFAIRVTDNGAKSFVVVARRAGQYHPHTHVIGPCAEWTIDDALNQVDGIVAQLRLGRNPKHEAKKSVEDTFEKAVEAFLARKKPKMRPTPAYQLEGDLYRCFMGRRRRRVWDKQKKEWTSEWVQDRNEYFRRTPVLSITYSDIRRRLREIEAEGGKYAARHAMAAIRSFFKWCLKEEEFGFAFGGMLAKAPRSLT